MISHFKKAGGNATRQFDTFRTELANEISRRAAIVGNHVYCWNYVERANAALQLSQAELKALTADEKNAALMHLSSKPMCDVKVVSNPDPIVEVAAVDPASGKDAGKAKPAPTKAAAAKPDAKAVTAAAKPPTKSSGKPAPEKAAAKPTAKPPAKATSEKVAANVSR